MKTRKSWKTKFIAEWTLLSANELDGFLNRKKKSGTIKKNSFTVFFPYAVWNPKELTMQKYVLHSCWIFISVKTVKMPFPNRTSRSPCAALWIASLTWHWDWHREDGAFPDSESGAHALYGALVTLAGQLGLNPQKMFVKMSFSEQICWKEKQTEGKWKWCGSPGLEYSCQ